MTRSQMDAAIIISAATAGPPPEAFQLSNIGEGLIDLRITFCQLMPMISSPEKRCVMSTP